VWTDRVRFLRAAVMGCRGDAMRAGTFKVAVGAVVLLVAAAIMYVAPAGATVVLPATNPYTVAGNSNGDPLPFTVTADSFTPGTQVFFEQCDGADPNGVGWDPTVDCDAQSSPASVTVDSGGNATTTFAAFKGLSPSSFFNCLSPDDPSPANGHPDWRNCQIRISSDNTQPTVDQQFLGIILPDTHGISIPAANPFAAPGDPTAQPLPFTIVASGLTPGTQAFVEQCDGVAPSAIGWSPTIDCDLGSSPAPVTVDSGGNATFLASSVSHAFTPFKGLSPQSQFNCLASNDAGLTNGHPNFTNCQVRVSSNNSFATPDQSFFTIALPNSHGISTPGLNPFDVPSTIAGDPLALTVTGSGFTPGQNVFVEQCDGTSSSAIGWSPTANCDLGSSPSPVAADANGNATFSSTVPSHAFTPFKGLSPQGLFNCLAADGTSPRDQSPNNGHADFRNCQIRVSSNNSSATTDQDFITMNLAVTHTAPSAPTILNLTFSDHTAKVTFSPPIDDGGVPITSYTASCTSPSGGLSASNTGSASPITVPGLSNAKPYSCTVSATNAVGVGTQSTKVNGFSPTGTPDAPTIGTVAKDDQSASVPYTTPFDGGAAIDSITATCTSSNGGAPGSNATLDNPIVVPGLTNGKTYTCILVAHNINGNGPASAVSNSFVPSTIPDPPLIGTVTRGNKLAVVPFIPGNDGGAPTMYLATCTSSNGGATGNHLGTTPITVSGLTNGKTYTCVVTAMNLNGSDPSGPSNSFVPATVPNAPTIGTLTRSGSTGSVSFSAPSSNGGLPITSYGATCTSTNGGVTRLGSGSSSPVNVTSLTLGKSYRCTAAARNAAGTGPNSAASNMITLPNLPGAPQTFVMLPAPTSTATGSLVASFAPPASNGGSAIDFYRVVCTSSNGGVTNYNVTTGSPISVTGLTTGKAYVCTISANNDVGAGPVATSLSVTVGSPGPPTGVTATKIFSGQLRVDATAPASNGSAITSYTATCTSTNGGVTRSASAAGGGLVVTGLTAGKTYRCTIHAVNARGSGVESAPSAQVVA
jgi:hypothetical protein